MIRLICWNEALAAERTRFLKGLDVDASPFNPAGMITRLRENPPSLFLIDLDRLPSHGREVGVALRNSKALREIPIVFAGGVEEKVERIRQELPDATFTDWAKAPAAVKRALKKAPAVLVTPIAHMKRFAGSPLAKKLDLKKGAKVILMGAEEGFTELLGDHEAELETKVSHGTSLMLWFVRSKAELEHAFEIAGTRMLPGCSIWIIYPKRAGRLKVDFNQNDVRLTGLAAGLVDYKICAVDDDWSGMKFAHRKGGVAAGGRR